MKVLSAWLLLTTGGFAAGPWAQPAAQVAFREGRITVVATDMPAADMLHEWMRAGGTVFEGIDPGLATRRVTLHLENVPERQALEQIVGQEYTAIAFYAEPSPTGSGFRRVVLSSDPAAPVMPGSSADKSRSRFTFVAVAMQDAAMPGQLSGSSEPMFVPAKTIVASDSILASDSPQALPGPAGEPPMAQPGLHYMPPKSESWIAPAPEPGSANEEPFRPAKTIAAIDDSAFPSLDCRATPQVCAPYNERADARSEVDKAITAAAAAGKRVLVAFGRNECAQCVSLEQLFRDDAVQPFLDRHYVIVRIDISPRSKNLALSRAMGDPVQKGLPAVVILDVPPQRGSPTMAPLVLAGDDVLADLKIIRRYAPRP